MASSAVMPSEMGVKIVKLPSGGEKLLLGGALFHFRLHKNNKTYWKCARKSCPATAITMSLRNGPVHVVKSASHNHPVSLNFDGELTDEDQVGSNDTNMEESDEDVEEKGPGEGGVEIATDSTDEESDDDTSDEDNGEMQKDILWREWIEDDSDDEEEADDNDYDDDLSDRSDLESDTETYTKYDRAFDVFYGHQDIYKEKIRFLRDPSYKIRAAIIEDAEKGLICYLNEICWNLTRGVFSLSKYERRLLGNFNDDIQHMANKNIVWREKKEWLIGHVEDPFVSVLLNSLAESHNFCT